MIDEYDEAKGGNADKFLIQDDANGFFSMLQTNYGEAVGKRLLTLYDCKGMSENFRRNSNEANGNGKRVIKQTSTSLLFGATWNVCQLLGNGVRSGLQRRFLIYAAEKHGRLIELPECHDETEMVPICVQLSFLAQLPDVRLQFSPEARALWGEFQRLNRNQMASESAGEANEMRLARLNGQPDHVLKIAIIFHAAQCAKAQQMTEFISAHTLSYAIQHVLHSFQTARVLDSIARRDRIKSDADIIHAKVISAFAFKAANGRIRCTRSELTGRFCHHSGRPNSFGTTELYSVLIPDLIKRSKAFEIECPGKQSQFEFRIEDAAF